MLTFYLYQKQNIIGYFTKLFSLNLFCLPRQTFFCLFFNFYNFFTLYPNIFIKYIQTQFYKNVLKTSSFMYRMRLKIFGNGFFLAIKDNILTLYFGKSHLHNIKVPDFFQIKIKGRKKRFLLVQTISYNQLQNFCFLLQNCCKPDIYRGKGLRFVKEKLKKKEGKKKFV